MATCRFVIATVAFAACSLLVGAAQGQDRLAIANVRVFTGVEVLERATIIVEAGRITQIAAGPPVNADVVIDGAGKTALPGLIDAHVHILAATAGVTEAETIAFVKDKLQDRMLSFLRHGVTT